MKKKQSFGFYLILLLKGIAMGGANVIPGVSGGTIAFITGIFERLIHAIKSFDLKAIKLFFTGQFSDFAKKTDLKFLIVVFAGVIAAIVSLARVLGYLLDYHPVYVWAFFFGLVLASVYFVGRTVNKWDLKVILFFLAGAIIAVFISLLNPARPNDNFFYLMICGAITMCSMILPGLSGSFVILLMGNYELIAIDAINNRDLQLLFPFIIGAGGGLIAFSHLLSWVFKSFRDQTIALLTGFVLGSLSILYPYKHTNYLTDEAGNFILKNGEKIVSGYQKYLPQELNHEVILSILFALAGIITIYGIEYFSGLKQKKYI